jgi:hypothetical protein
MATKRISLNELRTLVKQIVKEERILKELDLSTYSKVMNRTYDYPWIKFLGDKMGVAKKYENINKIANELFKKEFNKKYNSTIINNGNEIYNFYDIKFNTNYTNYLLIFKNKINDTLYIKFDKSNGYYVDKYNFEDNFDNTSKNKLKDMLQYNDFSKMM